MFCPPGTGDGVNEGESEDGPPNSVQADHSDRGVHHRQREGVQLSIVKQLAANCALDWILLLDEVVAT